MISKSMSMRTNQKDDVDICSEFQVFDGVRDACSTKLKELQRDPQFDITSRRL